ncbi:MAG: diacylglycerol kinase family lipid kinase [Pyrinomonadaceae bacterium]|nr:diacylglycerol kinase family lipid kinase [Pyrinomonadaceae bacterium]
MSLNLQNNDSNNIPLIIVNPKSASGSTQTRWARIASDWAAHYGAFNVDFTEYRGHGIELAKKAAETGRKFIVACGGDGTINEVANGILLSGKDAELGVLPQGTGGDFRRTIEMPSTIRRASEALKNGVTKKIDVGKVTYLNHKDETEERFFLNISSVGLSASIIERVKTTGNLNWITFGSLRGKASFAYSALHEVLNLDVKTIRVRFDENEVKSLQSIVFCVANARYFGGGMKMAPDAVIDDGLLNVVNIGELGTGKIVRKAPKLYAGTHYSLDEVKHTTAKRIEISAFNNEEIHLETDGELPGKLPAVFEIFPKALKIRVPKK